VDIEIMPFEPVEVLKQVFSCIFKVGGGLQHCLDFRIAVPQLINKIGLGKMNDIVHGDTDFGS
jgi:hypothetical protein